MRSIKVIRQHAYDYHHRVHPYIFNKWRWYSYRKWKAVVYIEVSPYLVKLWAKLKVSPNTVTIIYSVLGVTGGILLAIPIKWLILTGIIFFYFRPFLDWCDGLLARETNKVTKVGNILDNWGAYAGWVSLWVGLCLYVGCKLSGVYICGIHMYPLFLYLSPILPSMFAINLLAFKKANEGVEIAQSKTGSSKLSLVQRVYKMVDNIFEHNTRTVDLICLVVLLELLTPLFITWAIFLAYLAWQIIYFTGCAYVVLKGEE